MTLHMLLKVMVHFRLKNLLSGVYFLVSMVVNCPFIPYLSVMECFSWLCFFENSIRIFSVRTNIPGCFGLGCSLNALGTQPPV